MKLIFCDNVIDHQVIEPDYEEEAKAAKNIGFTFYLISFEELIEGNISKALKYIPKNERLELGIYRGWMLTLLQYQNLYNGLLDKNIRLINAPEAYRHCHYLPNSYDKIASNTPKSIWTKNLDFSNLKKLTNEFGTKPIIVKDFVKSEKHHWEEACFVPDASDKEKLKVVVDRFLELRGNTLNEGLVFREFEELEFLTHHSKSQMPLTKEFRVFFAFQKMVAITNYWEEGDYDGEKPDLEEFITIAKNIESNFFTMDIAQKKDSNWLIMELGDGQVAGLPDDVDKSEFYKNLVNIISMKASSFESDSKFQG